MSEINLALENLAATKNGEEPRENCPYCEEVDPKTYPDDDGRTGVTDDGTKGPVVVVACCKQYVVSTDDLEKIISWDV